MTGSELGRRGAVVALAWLTVGCGASSSSFRLTKPGPDEAAIAGRVTVLYNDKLFNENCVLDIAGRSFKLSADGIVLMWVPRGWTSLGRLTCKDTSLQHVQLRGANFFARGEDWVSDFGDVAIAWNNAGGFKASTQFGLIGALVDESGDDGEATITARPSGAAVHDAFQHQTGTPGRWSVQPLSRPVDPAAPPRDPDLADASAPGFFCTSPASGGRGVPLCEREAAGCERVRAVLHGGACTRAATAWCHASQGRLLCSPRSEDCETQREKAQKADACGEQY